MKIYEKTEMTRQEKVVMQQILEGKSNAEISEALSVSVNTIKTHVSRVLKKNNVKNRVQLISKQINYNKN